MKNSFLLLFILSNAINAFLFIPNINSCFSRKTSASCGNIARLSLASSNSGSYSSHSACTPSKPAAAFGLQMQSVASLQSLFYVLFLLENVQLNYQLHHRQLSLHHTSYTCFSAHFLIDSL